MSSGSVQQRTMAACALVGVIGLIAFVASLTLPWQEVDYHVGAAVRWTMAAAGALILAVTPRTTHNVASGAALFALGTSVMAYPTLLGLAAADVGGPPMVVLASAGHVVPLTMVQLAPVLVSGHVTGRSRRGWACVVLAVAAVGAGLTGLGLSVEPSGGPLLTVASLLWFCSFTLAPVACWTAVRGTAGHRRRRGIIAGLASLIPVLIIVWCMTLGGLGSALDLAGDPTTTALFLGFSAATTGCALLSVAALSEGSSPLLRSTVVVGLMRAMVLGVVVLVASGVALATISLLPTREAAVLVAVALTVVLGWSATRVLQWAAGVVDPVAELRLEIERASGLLAGRHRGVAESVVRRVLGDQGAALAFGVEDGRWVDVAGRVLVLTPSQSVVLVREQDEDVVLLVSGDTRARRDAAAWGDCALVLGPALMEAREAWQSGRASVAAQEERARLQQDLHDGLQGRLLGLALNLQMSRADVDDPVARLVISETVGELRGAVQDVRAMAGGRLPQILVDDGLEAAVRAFVQPVRARIGALDLSPDLASRRPVASVEACAYYVVGEAINNAIKHAGCDRIDVSISTHDDSVVVRVSDDGSGGADVRLGSGLRGLTERVHAHGGLLIVSDLEESGTLVEAVLPCGR
ncbi:sensor histidine kinase [Nocardioides lijunqiniae]|uniref:sensor histidine kinase n=1 Tax=Nocardioides lijunqiniae TaxID=2760832 RepID=UPI0018781831|nr:ATP-binding protein [Nocardioides lijunqiniae]